MKVRPAPVASLIKRLLRIRRVEITTTEGRFWVDPASDPGISLASAGIYDPATLGARIASVYPADYLLIGGVNWFIVGEGTAKDVADKLGLAEPPVSGIVVAVSGYFGRAPSNIWEWLGARVKASSNG